MEQILVVKSSKKDVLVKNVGPTLFQSPQGAPSFMDLVNAARGKGTEGGKLGMGGRLVGVAGLAGKGLAGLQTVNQVAQQAQGGNPLGAVLGAGYTFEANDPTGRRTATAIQGSAPGPTGPPPVPTPQHVNVGVGSYNANQITPFNPFPGHPQNVAPAPATTTRTGPPPAPVAPAPVAPAPVAVGPTGRAAAARKEFNEQFPTPSLVPQQPIPPMQQFPSTPVTPATPTPATPAPATPAPATPAPATTAPVPATTAPMSDFLAQQQARYNLDPSDPRYLAPGQTTAAMRFAQGQSAPASAPTEQLTQTTVPGPGQGQAEALIQEQKEEQERLNREAQQRHQEKVMTSQAHLFSSTLMEKLGADTVYKMSPHQIAALSAYTFLKLS